MKVAFPTFDSGVFYAQCHGRPIGVADYQEIF